MRTMNRALATGLIVAATFGLAAGPVFAADATTTPPAAQPNDTTQQPAQTPNDNATAPKTDDSNQAAQPQPDTNKSQASTDMANQPKKHAMMSRKKVEQIQSALDNSGSNIPVDGLWGPKTKAALADFQKSHGLKATGHLDRETIKALPKNT